MRVFLSIVMLIFLVGARTTSAQTKKIDSLISTLDTIQSSKEKVNTLNDISQYMANHDYDKSLDYAFQALSLAEKDQYHFGLVGSCYNIGANYFRMSIQDSSLKYAQIGYELAKEHKMSKMEFAILNLMALIQKKMGNWSEAIRLNYLFLNLCEEKNDTPSIAAALVNLGSLEEDRGDKKNAKKHLVRALDLLQYVDIYQYKIAAYTSIYHVEDDLSKKMAYLDKAIKLSLKHNARYYLGVCYKTYGYFYYEEKMNYDSALFYYNKARVLAEESKDFENLNNIYTMIGTLYQKIGQPNKAIDIFNRTIEGLKEDEDVKQIEEVYTTLSLCYADIGQFDKAYKYLLMHSVIDDSLRTDHLDKQLAEATTKYESNKKEAEISAQQLVIERQKNKNDRLLLSSILALLLATTIFVWYNSRNKRKKRDAEIALEKEHAETIKLREVDEMKTQFFTNISHELRTPLTLIIDPLENALESMGSIDSSQKISLAHSNSKKLLGLVNEIMDLSKLESGKLQLIPKSIELNPLIKRIFFAFESLAKIRDVKLILDNQIEEGVYVNLDADKFEKILNNLCSNAIKFSPKGGVITMKALEEGESLSIGVKDEGIGIKKDELDRVFDRFYQSNNQGQSLQGGTGVGLALSKQLALLFGGDLTVQSEYNYGSTFTLKIPKLGWQVKDVIEAVETIEENISPSQIEYTSLLINGDLPRVLIVEDNQEMSQYLKDLLSSSYYCTIANDGMEALKLVQTKSFDLITSDVMMPHMDGFKFREKVNAISNLRQIPFIFLTARALEEDKLFGLQLGVDDFITKPFNAKELKARIHNLLSNKIAREEWLKEHSDQKDNAVVNDDAETQLLKEAEKIVFKNIANVDFKVSDLAQHLNYGDRQLRRIIKKLTGLSPVNFILEIRLQKAYQLLERRQFLTVSEVRYEIGIDSASYFTTKFKQRFGRNPKEILG